MSMEDGSEWVSEERDRAGLVNQLQPLSSQVEEGVTSHNQPEWDGANVPGGTLLFVNVMVVW